eukprot:237896-Pleurochrysis_carterae.AAC.1
MAELRKGPGRLESKAEGSAETREGDEHEGSSSTVDAYFPQWDAIPNEYIIKHPQLVWDRLFVSALPCCALIPSDSSR